MKDIASRSVSEICAVLKRAEDGQLGSLIRYLSDDSRPGVVAAVHSARNRATRWKAEQNRLRQLYLMEDTLRDTGVILAAGVDEVGRGALAGPLTAGACILPARPRIEGLDDSKRLTPARREELDSRIRETAVAVAVAHVPADVLDQLGVTAALRLAMTTALEALDPAPHHVLVDGNPIGVSMRETAVVKGDSIVAAIAAASIVAKVARDSLMRGISDRYQEYGFAINKGYGTSEHVSAITTHGLSDIHRRSFCRSFTDPRLF